MGDKHNRKKSDRNVGDDDDDEIQINTAYCDPCSKDTINLTIEDSNGTRGPTTMALGRLLIELLFFRRESSEPESIPPKHSLGSAYRSNPESVEELIRFLYDSVIMSYPLRLAESEAYSGRLGVYTIFDIQADTEVFRDEFPLFDVVSDTKQMGSTCDWCLWSHSDNTGRSDRSGEDDKKPLLKCSKCKMVSYCSKGCQSKAWKKHHRSECLVYKTYGELPLHLRIMLRVLLNLSGKDANAEIRQALLLALTPIPKEQVRDGTVKHVLEFFTSEIITTVTAIGVPLGVVARLCRRVHFNTSSSAPSHVLKNVGSHFSFFAAHVNHSCEPNVFVFSEGGHVVCRALRDIEKGEELKYAAVDVDHDFVIRQKTLGQTPFFYCKCNRCNGGSEDTGLEIFKVVPSEKYPFSRDLLMEAMGLPLFQRLALSPDHINKTFGDIKYNTFVKGEWPEHLQPLTEMNIQLATHYRDDDNFEMALRTSVRLVFPKEPSVFLVNGPRWIRILGVIIGVIPKDKRVLGSMPGFTLLDTFPLTLIRCICIRQLALETTRLFGKGAALSKVTHQIMVEQGERVQNWPELYGVRFISKFREDFPTFVQWAFDGPF